MTYEGWTVEEIVESELTYFRSLYEKNLITFEEYQQSLYQTYDWAEDQDFEEEEFDY